jgi:hypothetical protein
LCVLLFFFGTTLISTKIICKNIFLHSRKMETFSLSWENFQLNFNGFFKTLFEEKDFADVTLVGDDNVKIQAHKFILGACSPKMKEILISNKEPHPLLQFKGTLHHEIQAILHFIYLGETTIDQDRIKNFFNVATILEVTELTTIAKQVIGHTGTPIFVGDATEIKNPLSQFDDDLVLETDNTEEDYTEENCSQDHQERLYKCESCENSYASKRMLYEHTRSKHIVVKYSCNKCEYQATKQSNLARHQASRHEGVKYSCCEYTCEATFSTEWDMSKHHEYMHKSARNHCNECEYKTSISNN